MKKVFFPNLDGLRFIAFFMVYMLHAFTEAFEKLPVNNSHLSNIFYTYGNGKTGVSIFFVLSGFLITYLILQETKWYGKLDIGKFYLRRTLRIWPLYYLVLIIVFVFIPLIIKLTGLDWSKYDMNAIYYYTFLSNFDVLRIHLADTLDFLPSTVTWSVAIEEQFYLVWPLLFLLIKPQWYKFIFLSIIIVSYAYRWYYRDDVQTLYFHTLSVCGDLGLGGMAAWLSINDQRFRNFFRDQVFIQRICFYTAGLLLMYLVQYFIKDIESWGRLIQTLFFAYVILDQNFCKESSMKFGNNKLISRIGKYTYGLYLYHPLVLVLMTTIISRVFHVNTTSPRNLIIIGIVAFPLCVAVSYLSYKYFESRFLRIKAKFSYISKGAS